MDSREELVVRCAQARAEKLGGLSEEAFNELVLAVRENPDAFVELDRDMAFREIVLALEAYNEQTADDEYLSDEDYLNKRRERFDAIAHGCERALSLDPASIDAQLLALLVSGRDTEDLLEALYELDEKVMPSMPAYTTDAYQEILCRPYLRVRSAVARTCLETARFNAAIDACKSLLSYAPADQLGARNTWFLALARLEDEEGFQKLQSRFSHRGNAWSYLANTLLLYKLGRLNAAKRALRGFSDLCRGGAYALLRPIFVDTYLPDRPEYEQGSFEEAIMAVHEADPIIVDTPDFISWVQAQPGIADAAAAFAQSQGFDY